MDREERGPRPEHWERPSFQNKSEKEVSLDPRGHGVLEGVVKDVRSEYLGEHIWGTDVNKADYEGWGARDEELKMVRQAHIISSLAWWEDWYLEQNLEWDQGWILKKKNQKPKTKNMSQLSKPKSRLERGWLEGGSE